MKKWIEKVIKAIREFMDEAGNGFAMTNTEIV